MKRSNTSHCGNLEDLESDGVVYSEVRWAWKAPSYRVDTMEFSEDQEIQNMNYLQYLEKWQEKLSFQNPNDTYKVVVAKSNNKKIINLLKIYKEPQ